MCRGVSIHYFKINPSIFCCPLFCENYLNPQVRISEMVNKRTVDYPPSPSQLISRIHPLIFLWTPKWFISPESLLDFFPKPVYSTMVAENFQIYSVYYKYIFKSKIKSVQFYSCPQAKLSPMFWQSSPRQAGIAHSSRTAFSEDIFSLAEREERIMEFKKLPKLTRVLVTSFDKFHHPCNLYIFALCFVVE